MASEADAARSDAGSADDSASTLLQRSAIARLLAAGGDGVDYPSMDLIFSWEASVLFASFILITLLWEFGTAVLAFITVHFSGRKALWLSRLKEEILALGVITLILTVIEGSLAKICIDEGPSSTDGLSAQCGPGKQQLFSIHLLHEVHLLLFETAVMYIIVTTCSFYGSLLRMRLWKQWEKLAREGDVSMHIDEVELMDKLGENGFVHMLKSLCYTVKSGVSNRLYVMLRVVFRLRIDGAMESQAFHLPRSFNFLNLVGQAMEVEFSEAAEMSWIIFFVLAVFLVIPQEAYPIFWLSGLSLIIVLTVSAKLQSIAVHMAAVGFHDYGTELQNMKIEHLQHMQRSKSATVRPSMDDPLGEPIRSKSLRSKSFMKKSQTGASTRLSPGTWAASPKGVGPKSFKSFKFGPSKVAPEDMGVQVNARSELVMSKMRSRLKVSFRNDESLSDRPERDSSELFWFSSPTFMLWVFQLSFMMATIALTLTFYGLIMDGSVFTESYGGTAAIAIVIIVDVLLLAYASINVLPVYALINTVGTQDPLHLVKEIQRAKAVEGSEEFEQGIGGKILKLCLKGAHHEEEQSEALKQFIHLLSDQAGVIGSHTLHKGEEKPIDPKSLALYQAFYKAWTHMTNDWRGAQGKDDPDTVYTMCGDVSSLRTVFTQIDKDHSGCISRHELAVILKAMGTRATAEELEDMIDALDVDGTDGIEFHEFVLFTIFKFMDQFNDGYVTRDDLAKALPRIQEEAGTEATERLIDYAMRNREGDMRRRIGMAEFIHGFYNLELQEVALTAPETQTVTSSLEAVPETDTPKRVEARLVDNVDKHPAEAVAESVSLPGFVAGADKDPAEPVAEPVASPGFVAGAASGPWSDDPDAWQAEHSSQAKDRGSGGGLPRVGDQEVAEKLRLMVGHIEGGRGVNPQGMAEELRKMAALLERSGTLGGTVGMPRPATTHATQSIAPSAAQAGRNPRGRSKLDA